MTTTTNTSCYQHLNLKEGASLSEIKNAFRHMAKAHHPDAAGQTSQDVDKFIKAQTAYQKLLKKAVAHNRTRSTETTFSSKTLKTVSENWRFVGRREAGLDIYYRLEVLKSVTGGEFKLVLPWQTQQACPRCLGQGQTLNRVNQSSLYRPQTCSKCEGRGSISRETKLETTISPEMVNQGKIRLRKAGLYNSKEARRGDLILEIVWVDHLPRTN